MTVDEDVRVAVYDSFARTGHAPSTAALAVASGQTETEVRQALDRLAEARHVVLGTDGRIVLAHPFASVPMGFSVMGAAALWWGGCAWDSFAIPHLVRQELDVLVATRCPGCGSALSWVVRNDAPPEGRQVAHFLVPMPQVWDDVRRACDNQRLYCSTDCVDRCLAQTGDQRGYVMDLATLWRLAQHWYDGRLDRGYRRREPAQASEYFREAGLAGAFWGL